MLTPSGLNAFDAVAPRYDELWTHSTIGRLQREAVWRRVDPLFRADDRLLDIGCGTGEDALHFANLGLRVRALDASSEMVRIARRRGVDAAQLAVEELDRVQGAFDGAISNFGALNCVENLDSIKDSLARLIRPGGHLALCLIGRFCLWETLWYLARAQPGKAFRRCIPGGANSSFGIRVHYPSIRSVRRALDPHFKLAAGYGIGIAIPPSYVSGISDRLLHCFAGFDRCIDRLLPALSDHRLLIFVRR